MEELNKKTPDIQETNRNSDGTFRKGFSGNLKGRPKGQSLKEYAREYFSKLTDEEKHEFLMGMPKHIIWRQAEGNPKEEIQHSGEINNPYAELTTEQKLQLIRRNLDGINQVEGTKGPDLSDGGNIELPKDGADSQEGGAVSQTNTQEEKGGNTDATKPPENNPNNNIVDNSTTNQ